MPELPENGVAATAQLFTWLKQCLLAQTHLSDDAAELVAFWVISTWFWGGLDFFPCLRYRSDQDDRRGRRKQTDQRSPSTHGQC